MCRGVCVGVCVQPSTRRGRAPPTRQERRLIIRSLTALFFFPPNPTQQFVQQATDPNFMRAMLQMQQMGMLPPVPAPPGGAVPPTAAATPNSFDFSALLGAMGGAGAGAVAPLPATPAADPATLYAAQLQQLQDMGFSDRERNLQVRVCGGVVGGGEWEECPRADDILGGCERNARRRWRPRAGT